MKQPHDNCDRCGQYIKGPWFFVKTCDKCLAEIRWIMEDMQAEGAHRNKYGVSF